VLPVIVSIVVIILVAILQKQSKLAAAITATMPVNVTLALLVVYGSNDGERVAMTEFTRGLMIAIVPTLAFLVTVWLAARAGWKLVPMLLAGYAVWALGVGGLMVVRKLVGM
jgi:hypothetical protein